jgi:hypothetical protein
LTVQSLDTMLLALMIIAAAAAVAAGVIMIMADSAYPPSAVGSQEIGGRQGRYSSPQLVMFYALQIAFWALFLT